MSESYSGFDPVDDVVESFLEHYRRGDRPSLTEYAEKHPDLAERIRALFPALMVMEELASENGEAKTRCASLGSASVELPRRLGDYILVRAIGSGGMGVVYEAIHESLGRHVALKTLPAHALGDAMRLERFRREARAAARLHHTHIVPVFGVGEHKGLHYYTMQFIRGHGLDTVLREVSRLATAPRHTMDADAATVEDRPDTLAWRLCTGRFPTEQSRAQESTVKEGPRHQPGTVSDPPPVRAELSEPTADSFGPSPSRYFRGVARLGVQAAEALEYAHQQGILHRDIKPSNLLLDARGELWVTDFGLAKADDSDELTGTGDIVGTLRFMAPERFSGWSDPRSDVFALGATLYELLTLQPAFRATDRVNLIHLMLNHGPRPPRQFDRRIPRDLETIVLKAMAREPGERYTTAGLLAQDLDAFIADKPILARRSSSLERTWRWSRRNPVLAAAAGVVTAALLAVAVISLMYAREQARANLVNQKLADRLTESLAESNRLLAIRNFDRGQAAFENEQVGAGLLWMIESWRSAVKAGDDAWQHAARANLAAWQPRHARLEAVLSHDSPVDAAAFSPDGKVLLTGGDDRVARLWDVADGNRIGQLLRHQGTVLAVAYHPDGKTLVTGSADKTARFWDARSQEPIGSPLTHDGEVRAVAFSPDGKTVLTGGSDHTARLWDASTHRLIGAPLRHPSTVVAVAFSPDSKTFLTANSDGPVRLWNACATEIRRPIVEFGGGATCAAFHPSGKAFIVGGVGAAYICDVTTGQARSVLDSHHQTAIRAVAFSPDGTRILTGGTDKTAQLWDAATNLPVGPPIRHQGPVVAVAFSPNGKTMLTASSDGTARLWDANSAVHDELTFDHSQIATAVAFSPDGKIVFTASRDATARRWDAATGRPAGPPLRHPDRVLALAVSPDGKTVLTGTGSPSNSSFHGYAQLWDAASGRPIGPPLEHQAAVTVVAFRPDGKTVATGSQDKTIRLWDAVTGAPVSPPIPQPGAVDAGAFSPDGKSFLAAYDIGEARLWDMASGTPVRRPFPHPGAVSAVAFSPDGKTLLTGCEDNMARLWHIASRTLLVPPLANHGWVFGVAFSPDGRTVLTGSREADGARLWDVATGVPLGPPLRHRSGVTAVAFSPDGEGFLTASYDGKARLFRNVPPLTNNLDRAATWVGALTGLSLDATHGSIRALDNAAWRAGRERLGQAGGPP